MMLCKLNLFSFEVVTGHPALEASCSYIHLVSSVGSLFPVARGLTLCVEFIQNSERYGKSMSDEIVRNASFPLSMEGNPKSRPDSRKGDCFTVAFGTTDVHSCPLPD